MASKNKTGIEKLEEYAYGMKPRRCDDVLELSAQIEREHVAELQTLEKRYKTDLREAREVRDIAIKEASKLRNDINLAKDLVHDLRSNIAIMLGISCDGMADDVQEAIDSELHKRLMPPGMEWPRFDDGERVEFGSAVDGLGGPCEKFIFTRSMGGVCQLQDAGGRMVNVLHGGRVKRQKPEVLGADGLPIKIGDTVYLISGSEPYRVERLPQRKDGMIAVYGLESKREKLYCYYPDNLTHTQPDTQERIDEDAKLDPCEYVRIVVEIITTRLILLAKIMRAWTVTITDLLRRQRELDARTMGGE